MAGEKDYEHEIEFDDLHPEEGEQEEGDTVVDLGDGEGEPGELDGKAAAAAAATDGDDDEQLDLDAILGPEQPDNTRYDRIESKLLEQDVRDRQNYAVTTTETAISKLDAECKDLRTQLRAAREAGKTDDELELEDKLADRRADLREQQRALDYYKSEDFSKALESKAADDGKGKDDDGATRRQAVRESLRNNKVMAAWVNRNRWYLTPKTAEERAAMAMVQGLDSELLKKTGGYNQAFFAELNRRVGQRFPELLQVKGAERSSAPRGGGEQGGHKRSTGTRVVLTADDKQTMKSFGLDPTNKQHVREYAANKR